MNTTDPNKTSLRNADGEVVVALADGSTLRSGTYEPGSGLVCGEYVRLVLADGTEESYWDHQEWAENPALVMGAIINSAAGLRFIPAAAEPEAAAQSPAEGATAVGEAHDNIVALTINHEYGPDTTVHATLDGAEAHLLGFVKSWWADEIGEATPIPADRHEAIAAYFDQVSYESYSLVSTTILD